MWCSMLWHTRNCQFIIIIIISGPGVNPPVEILCVRCLIWNDNSRKWSRLHAVRIMCTRIIVADHGVGFYQQYFPFNTEPLLVALV